MADYTYYGDLLGVSSFYKLDPQRAYQVLNDFYNEAFNILSPHCRSHRDEKVSMISDTLLVWGKRARGSIELLEDLHRELLKKGLLLRGAVVHGKLEFDPRITLENFDKQLPTNDTLARAVGLSGTQKGGRLLIEPALATELLTDCQHWATPEGYLENCRPEISLSDLRRRITNTPDCQSHEVLFVVSHANGPESFDIEQVRKELDYLSSQYDSEIVQHFTETIAMIDRAVKRREATVKLISSRSGGRES